MDSIEEKFGKLLAKVYVEVDGRIIGLSRIMIREGAKEFTLLHRESLIAEYETIIKAIKKGRKMKLRQTSQDLEDFIERRIKELRGDGNE